MLRNSQILQLVVLALLSLAVVMVQSAGMTAGDPAAGLVDILLSRNVAYALLAVAAMLLCSRVDLQFLFDRPGWSNPIGWGIFVALLLTGLTLVPGVGRTVNGASRWLQVGGISIQPSEMLKWLLVLALALWCARKGPDMGRFFTGLLPPLLLAGLCCGLVLVQDLGTAVLMGMVAVVVLLAGGARWWQLLMLIPPAALALLAAIVQSPYRVARLTAFMNPWADPQGIGYHPIQSMVAIAQGGLVGRGLGNGIQKFGYLPEDTTDFLFAIICEELGLIGALAVVALYLVLLWIGFSILRRCRHSFGKLVALGVLLTVGLQALINLAVVTVLVPTKGIALPLLSSGGTGWVLTAAAIGLLAALDEANYVQRAGLGSAGATAESAAA